LTVSNFVTGQHVNCRKGQFLFIFAGKGDRSPDLSFSLFIPSKGFLGQNLKSGSLPEILTGIFFHFDGRTFLKLTALESRPPCPTFVIPAKLVPAKVRREGLYADQLPIEKEGLIWDLRRLLAIARIREK